MGHCFKIVPALLVAAVAVSSCGSGGGIVSALLSGLSGSQTESPAETFAGELSATKPEVGGALMEIPASDAGGVLITHKGYTLSYNAAARIPEWVAYELTADETYGDADRDDAMFRMDPSFKKTQAMREDYSGSGWTKGHMACAADFQWDEDAMDETFYLTNICPQDEVLNAGDWNYLEKQTRRWARENGRVWVVSGPIIGDNIYGRIGERNVVVPDAFFKAVLMEKHGKYHSIAFVMGNDDERYYLYDCSMSVNELEKLTGIDFFPALDDSVEESVESRTEYSVWDIKVQKKS